MSRGALVTGAAIECMGPARWTAMVKQDVISRLVDSIHLKLKLQVSFDCLWVGITDPTSGLTTTLFSPGHKAMRFRCADPAVRVSEMGGIPDAARRRDPIARLSAATAERLGAGPRYRDFLRLNAIGYEMRAALTVSDLCCGFLILQRGEDCPDFSAKDAARVRSSLPRFTDELWTGLRRTAVQSTDQPPPGIVVVDSANTMRGLSAHAEALIRRTPAFHPLVPNGLPVPLGAVIEQLRTSGRQEGRRFLVPGSDADGWFVVSGSRVNTDDGDCQFVMSLESAKPTDLTSSILRARGLTTRENAVTIQVIQGLSTAEVAQDLGISHHTVQDHLKAVFAKTGVNSRRDLARMVLRDSRWE